MRKHNDFLVGWRERRINLQSCKNEGRAHFTWENTTISPGLAGVAYKFTVKMKPRRIGVTWGLKFPFLTRATCENFEWQWLSRGIPPATRRVFLGKILRFREQLASSHVNSESLLNARSGLLEKTQGKWTRGMWQDSCEAHFMRKKTRNVGAIDRITCKFTVTLNARRAFIEKTHGIWKGFRDARFSWKKIRIPGGVGRVSYEFIVTVNARRMLPEKTQGMRGLVEPHFSRKITRVGGGGSSVAYKFTVKMKPRRIFT